MIQILFSAPPPHASRPRVRRANDAAAGAARPYSVEPLRDLRARPYAVGPARAPITEQWQCRRGAARRRPPSIWRHGVRRGRNRARAVDGGLVVELCAQPKPTVFIGVAAGVPPW
jgi:hypothetical protein